MRVLVGCETSGKVRDAFAACGHDAWSCDLLPTDAPGPHYQGDVMDIIGDGWDLMIAHPPCTYLCVSGLHWNKRRPERAAMTEAALGFVQALMDCDIPQWAIENPVGCISTRIRKPDQTIQPWQFGHPESKATCLWLKGLPTLKPTNVLHRPAWVKCEQCDDYLCTLHDQHVYDCPCPPIEEWKVFPYTDGGRWDNQTPSGQNKLPPSPDRWKLRSETYSGIASAMADQWGSQSEYGKTLFEVCNGIS